MRCQNVKLFLREPLGARTLLIRDGRERVNFDMGFSTCQANLLPYSATKPRRRNQSRRSRQ